MARRRPQNQKRRKHLEKERARRRENSGIRFRGKVEHNECRLNLILSTPPGVIPDRQCDVIAIIDTGCTQTAINPDLASQLGLPVIRQATVSTASSGTQGIQCNVVMAALGFETVDGQSGFSLREMIVAPMTNDVLFGMDALRGGVLTVDMVKHTWEWHLKEFGSIE